MKSRQEDCNTNVVPDRPSAWPSDPWTGNDYERARQMLNHYGAIAPPHAAARAVLRDCRDARMSEQSMAFIRPLIARRLDIKPSSWVGLAQDAVWASLRSCEVLRARLAALRVSEAQMRLYVALTDAYCYAAGQDGIVQVDQRTLSQRAGMSRDAVDYNMPKLYDTGFVAPVHPGKGIHANTYRIVGLPKRDKGSKLEDRVIPVLDMIPMAYDRHEWVEGRTQWWEVDYKLADGRLLEVNGKRAHGSPLLDNADPARLEAYKRKVQDLEGAGWTVITLWGDEPYSDLPMEFDLLSHLVDLGETDKFGSALRACRKLAAEHLGEIVSLPYQSSGSDEQAPWNVSQTPHKDLLPNHDAWALHALGKSRWAVQLIYEHQGITPSDGGKLCGDSKTRSKEQALRRIRDGKQGHAHPLVAHGVIEVREGRMYVEADGLEEKLDAYAAERGFDRLSERRYVKHLNEREAYRRALGVGVPQSPIVEERTTKPLNRIEQKMAAFARYCHGERGESTKGVNDYASKRSASKRHAGSAQARRRPSGAVPRGPDAACASA